MKQITKKLMLMLLTAILLVGASLPANAFAADQMNLTLRIEGINENIYYDTVKVPYTGSLTLQAALSYIDSKEDGFAITGVDTAYITDINGEAAGQFGGWDGWLYKVNGLDATVGIDSMQLSEGDSILLYYGDPFGVGMQYPVADASKLADGIISFTSSDTTYDANYNATVTVNPVVGATVTFQSGDVSTDYVTNDKGEISIDKALLTPGAHAVQISKLSDKGIPQVLRFAPDYTVSVEDVASPSDPANVDTNSNNQDNEATQTDATSEAPKTGDNGHTTAIILGLAALVTLGGLIFLKKKSKNEK